MLANMPVQLAGLRILDVGAGVNPLPCALARRGANVVTIDNHPLQRTPGQREEWNEWGFLDYSQLEARIASLHVAYEDSLSSMTFDCIYSVSVIEHLRRAVRQCRAGKFAAQLAVGGLLLLTVELIPDTNLLWNLSEGTVVEPTSAHGEVASLLDALRAADFPSNRRAFNGRFPIPGSMSGSCGQSGDSHLPAILQARYPHD